MLGDAGAETEQGWEDFPVNRFQRGASQAELGVRQDKAALEPWHVKSVKSVKSDAIWVTAPRM